jgi:hypothetical protein
MVRKARIRHQPLLKLSEIVLFSELFSSSDNVQRECFCEDRWTVERIRRKKARPHIRYRAYQRLERADAPPSADRSRALTEHEGTHSGKNTHMLLSILLL